MRAVSAAKIKIADSARHISQESVQLHGGMGMSEELKISHSFRRLTVIAGEFGDADHHLAALRVAVMKNRRVLLASRPRGWVSEADFRLDEAPVPQPAEGEVLVRNLWLSLDPYMRGRMSDAKSYVKGVDLGEVMVGQTVGEVVESRNPALRAGRQGAHATRAGSSTG